MASHKEINVWDQAVRLQTLTGEQGEPAVDTSPRYGVDRGATFF